MKLLLRANGKINEAKIEKDKDGTIYGVEIDFNPSDIWSDIEMWLNDSTTDDFIDYAKMYLSKRNKMKFYKN